MFVKMEVCTIQQKLVALKKKKKLIVEPVEGNWEGFTASSEPGRLAAESAGG